MKRELWDSIEFFNYVEFNSPDHDRSGLLMDYEFICRLDSIRRQFGKPIYINSGYRTEEHNDYLIKAGAKASPNSSHMKGIAVDIKCSNDADRFELVALALAHGFSRIGIAKTFIHLDYDEMKNQKRIWVY